MRCSGSNSVSRILFTTAERFEPSSEMSEQNVETSKADEAEEVHDVIFTIR